MVLEEAQLYAQFLWLPHIVRIAEGNEVTLSRLQTIIARLGEPLVFFMPDRPDPGIRRREATDHLPGVIRRAIIDNNQFQIRMALAQNTSDRFRQEPGM